MTAVYEEITLAWNGQEHTVRPSYRMVQQIEGQGISIVGVCHRAARGEPPMSHVAAIVSHMLRSAGARKASPEDVYEYLITRAGQADLERIITAITVAFIPVSRAEASEGNAAAPTDGTSSETSPPRSTGESTTR